MSEFSPSSQSSIRFPPPGTKLAVEDIPPAPCQRACPIFVDIPSYLTLLAQGQYQPESPCIWLHIKQKQ